MTITFWGKASKRCLNRGGNWNNGGNAGVFNSNLNNGRENVNTNIGGRSAFRLRALLWRCCAGHVGCALRGAIGAQTKRGLHTIPADAG